MASHPTLHGKGKTNVCSLLNIFFCACEVLISFFCLLPRLNNPSSLNLSQGFMFSKPLIILLQLS